MPLFGDEFIQGAKKAKEIAGIPNMLQRELMEMLDPQCKNLFEVLLYPANFSSDPKVIAHSIMDTLVARLHIQNINVPFFGLEYERANWEKYVKDVTQPDEMSMTFIENEESVMRNYLQAWINQVVVASSFLGNTVPYSTTPFSGDAKYNYVFSKNQYKSKKNAKIFLKMGSSLPSLAYIQVEGLKFKSMSAWDIGHDQEEPLRIECTFAIDNAYVIAPANLL